MNAQEVLNNVNAMLSDNEEWKRNHHFNKTWAIREVCNDLNIFDWWNDNLSVSQLKQMKKFLETAILMGYTGYACFKVGAKYCSNGMWAHKEESTTGYSPDGECLYHSFVNGENYYDVCLKDGRWLHDKSEDERFRFTLKEVKAALIANA